MNKVAHYLQQHLVGEVLTSPEVVNYFSYDESIFTIKPLLVVHPRNENDLRKAARFSWQLAERGRVVPITMRGKGTDQTGAALGNGIILSTPAHMNKIIELDPKSGAVTAQSGVNVAKLQQTLHTHGRYLPAVSDSAEYTTVGGAVANNDAGRNAYKYGPLREHTTGMRVVLANGELIRTSRLSKRELNKKLGLASFEGQIYRELDKIIEDSEETIQALSNLGDRSNVGYAIADVKLKDGSFDLTPLFVGSQSTLGLISEATFEAQVYDPSFQIVVAKFSSLEKAFAAVNEINAMKKSPATVDFIDKTVVDHVRKVNPSVLKKTLDKETPEITLFIGLDEGVSKRAKKSIVKLLDNYQADIVEVAAEDQDAWEALRESVLFMLNYEEGAARALPLVNDAYVPVVKLATFIEKARALLSERGSSSFAFWGQAGSGVVQAMPLFDISQVGDRQRMFKLLDEYYSLVADMGGSVAAASAEGRLRASQSYKVLTQDMLELMQRIKKVFDPFNTLNPGVKVGVDIDNLKSAVRSSYQLHHQHSHLPR